MLAGMMLGPVRGGLAVALLLFLVALGLPFLAGGRGGIGVFYGMTAGYLAGYFFLERLLLARSCEPCAI